MDDFADECLREHNKKRALHGVPPLRHSHALDRTARDWADQLLDKDSLQNSPLSSRGEIGESISMRTSTGNFVDIQGAEVVNQWYGDSKSYDFATGKGPAGNFTQLIWSSTREVGFGKARVPGRCVVVAHYRPPGNVRGRYLENVYPLGGESACSKVNETVIVGGGETSYARSEDGSEVIKRTVVTETVKDPEGRQYVVRRETTETSDKEGNVQKRVSETYLDDKSKPWSSLDRMSGADSGGLAVTTRDGSVFSDEEAFERELMAIPDSLKRARRRELREFTKDIIRSHNFYRIRHQASKLKHDRRLSLLAQQWADHLIDEVCLSNSGFTFQGTRIGENIISRWCNSSVSLPGHEVVDHWYQEASKVKYGTEPESVQGIGNFCQLVWLGSRHIGVGKAVRSLTSGLTSLSGRADGGDGRTSAPTADQIGGCGNSEVAVCSASTKTVIVCFYHPPGNVTGQFIVNCLPPLRPDITDSEEVRVSASDGARTKA